ncbi:MAG TPA: DUF1684 domain-containing protein [Candidatus Limnocylindrales bacterium]|nr:DUF1684 domain-containing protein [Candidatus Limnocylindrales bacterium]
MSDDPDQQQHHDHVHHDHRALTYAEEVEAFRADKDDFFKTHPRSPLPEAERGAFGGLPYYAVDEDLRFEDMRLEPYAGDEPSDFQIPTSDGQLKPAHRAGTLRFAIDDAPMQLTAYTFDGGDGTSLFVPFLDPTSGTETYGAGRYLDLEPEDDGSYALDFNLAYHPSCVYDYRFSCPLTPAENRLPVRIEAGERLATDGPAGVT